MFLNYSHTVLFIRYGKDDFKKGTDAEGVSHDTTDLSRSEKTMRVESLSKELDAITQDYNYGIVPGSAAVFIRDEEHRIGRLDLTLLEGVMIVVELSDQGFKIMSYSSLSSDGPAASILEIIISNLQQPFESMENLLMTISPMFRERFEQAIHEKLQDVQQRQRNEDSTESTLTSTTNYEADFDSWLQ